MNEVDQLNPSSMNDPPAVPAADAAQSSSSSSSIPKGKGRLIRDADGNVIGVDLPDDAVATGAEPSREADTPWGAPMAEDRTVAPVAAKTSVVQGQ